MPTVSVDRACRDRRWLAHKRPRSKCRSGSRVRAKAPSSLSRYRNQTLKRSSATETHGSLLKHWKS
jgi:hypothetical protein